MASHFTNNNALLKLNLGFLPCHPNDKESKTRKASLDVYASTGGTKQGNYAEPIVE